MDQDQAAAPEVRFDNAEEQALKDQLRRGDLAGLRSWMARTREQHDWQDRIFLLMRVVSSIRPAALNFACDTEPEAADLQVVRAALFSHMAAAMRGTGTCDNVAEEGWVKAGEAVQKGVEALNRVAQLDAGDPTAFACMLPALMIYGQTMPLMQRAFQHAIRIAPDLVPAHRSVVNASAKRWYGSHEDSLQMAREAMKHAAPGSDMAACLFWAHSLIRSHYESFDKNPKAADEYAQNPEVQRELAEAFDAWVAPPYVPRRSSVPFLGWAGQWFFRVRDGERLQRVLDLTRGDYAAEGWGSKHDYQRAELFAAGKINPGARPDPSLHCLVVLGTLAHCLKEGNLPMADAALQAARQLEAQMLPAGAAEIRPVIVLYDALLHRRRKKADEARRLRDEALRLLESAAPAEPTMGYHELLARAFTWMDDAQLAIPHWEQALTLAGDKLEGVARAEMLLALGQCYLRSGLRDHAAIPLRAAVRVFRLAAGDPHLTEALMVLGSALSRSSPDEAEALFRESADLHNSNMKFESATVPWLNLGVLLSENGRHAEAAELYDRILRIREQSRGLAPSRVAIVLNNIASNYRRMGKFREAHAAIDRAIKVYEAGDKGLASALGTRGMIYLDEGRDKDAAKWLENAISEFRRQPSPNMTSMAEDLDRLIGALTRLGRTREAETAQRERDALRARLGAIPQSEQDSGGDAGIAGAVLIELTGVNRLRGSDRYDDVMALVHKTLDLLRLQDVGFYRGKVAIPESTTLIYHSRSPESLWSTIESCVCEEPIAAGAKITIRDGATHREVLVPMPVSTLN
jgi:tetratricopeptide (TPR) repeat protein